MGSLEVIMKCPLQPAADSERLLQTPVAGILLPFPGNYIQGQVPLLIKTFSLVILCPLIKGAVDESPSSRILNDGPQRSQQALARIGMSIHISLTSGDVS